MARKRADRVKEPVQVYLDQQDAALLTRLSEKTGLPKAELLRRGLRQLAAAELTEKRPGWSLDVISGILGADPGYPPDYAARHDEYLAQLIEKKKGARSRPR